MVEGGYYVFGKFCVNDMVFVFGIYDVVFWEYFGDEFVSGDDLKFGRVRMNMKSVYVISFNVVEGYVSISINKGREGFVVSGNKFVVFVGVFLFFIEIEDKVVVVG